MYILERCVEARTSRRVRLFRALAIGALLSLMSNAQAFAQGSSTSSSLPGLTVLPQPSEPPRLPGPDARDCGSSKWEALCARGRWSQYARMEVTLKAGSFTGHYTMEKPTDGEALTTYNEWTPKGRRGGEVLLVGDDAYAYRTRETLPPNDDLLDYLLAPPNMVAQLTSVLLDQAVLGAPAEVTQRITLDANSATQYVRTETPASAALYGPPWKVTGTIRPGANQRLDFALHLVFHPVDRRGRLQKSRTESLDLTGWITFADRRRLMPDTFDLVGWKLMRGNGDSLSSVATLEEARRAAVQ